MGVLNRALNALGQVNLERPAETLLRLVQAVVPLVDRGRGWYVLAKGRRIANARLAERAAARLGTDAPGANVGHSGSAGLCISKATKQLWVTDAPANALLRGSHAQPELRP